MPYFWRNFGLSQLYLLSHRNGVNCEQISLELHYNPIVLLSSEMEVPVNEEDKDQPVATNFYCQTTTEFQNALKSSVENILKRVSDDVFIEIYKDCYKGFQKRDDIERPSLSGSSAEARKYRKQFNAMVMQSISEITNETLTTGVDCKLKELEELKEEQSDSSFQWRPPGNAFKHMIPFDTVSKMEEKKQYESCIKKEKEVINLLKARVTQKRLKVKELHDILQSSFKKIENAVVIPVSQDERNTSTMENVENQGQP